MSDFPTVTSKSLLYHGKKFDYQQLTVRHPSGFVFTREMVKHPGACIILPKLDDGRIVLIRCWRSTVERPLLELPAGTLEPGEPPASTAHRELIEEAGYDAASITPICHFYTSPGLSDEIMHAFLATGLRHVGQKLEPYEHITLHPVTPDEALAMIDRSEILDGKSILTLLHARRKGLI